MRGPDAESVLTEPLEYRACITGFNPFAAWKLDRPNSHFRSVQVWLTGITGYGRTS